MIRYNVLFQPEAEANLDEIFEYTVWKYGNAKALFIIQKLVASAKKLSFMPRKFRRVDTNTNREIRCCVEGKYRIFYEVYGDMVRILRIHHTSRSERRFNI